MWTISVDVLFELCVTAKNLFIVANLSVDQLHPSNNMASLLRGLESLDSSIFYLRCDSQSLQGFCAIDAVFRGI